MEYNLDLRNLSIEDYKELLKNQNLLPGRRILLLNIDQNFEIIRNCKIKNVFELKKALSTSKRVILFASKSGLTENYLKILRRETGTFEQRPVLLKNFPGIAIGILSNLEVEGIKTSKDYYERYSNKKDELFCLCDLARINGVGPLAARVFYEAGYQCVSDVAYADASVMLNKVTKINEAKHYYKANLGIKDMQFCIDFANLLIKYDGK
jgi:hypothetical protein